MHVEKSLRHVTHTTPTRVLQNLQSTTEWRCSHIMSGVQRRTTDISQKIDDNLGRLDHTVGQLTEDVVGLKTAVHAAGQRRQKMWWD